MIRHFTRLASFAFATLIVAGAAAQTRTKIERAERWTPPSDPSLRVIYGNDDRIDVYQEMDPGRLALAAATCGLFFPSDVTDNGDGTHTIDLYAYTVGGDPACPGEPFGDQPSTAFCTGFLVGTDLIATAGHCFDAGDLNSTRFVFGFQMLDASTPRELVEDSRVYTGVELVGHARSGDGTDYAVIRVDRPVDAPGSAPLPIRRTGTIPDAEPVGVIGHPAGLPMKIAFGDQTRVYGNGNPIFFEANLDTYGGNSGSPVFNQMSGMVEGILVRGAQDFIDQGNCFVSNELPDSPGGEDCTRTTTFANLVPEIEGVHFGAAIYGCGDTVMLTIFDDNAPGRSLAAGLTTGAGDDETVTFTDPLGDNLWTASIPIAMGGAAVTPGDGMVQGDPLDTLTITYQDADSGGAPETFMDTASLDCVPPVIESVAITAIGANGFTVEVMTDESAMVGIEGGTTCGDAAALGTSGSGTAHTIFVGGLESCTAYHITATAADAVGNIAFENNSGSCFSAITGQFAGGGLDEDFEPTAGAGWTHSAAQGSDNWAVRERAEAHSPTHVHSMIPGPSAVTDASLVTPAFPGGGTLSFWHTFDFETGSQNYDGAVLEISTNGGSSWTDLGPHIFAGGSIGSISTSFGSPIGGQMAWTGGSIGAMEQVMVDLSSFPGTVQVRFRYAADSSVGSAGWLIDDVVAGAVEPCPVPLSGVATH